MAKKPLKYLALVEYHNAGTYQYHKFTASVKEADAWAASIMQEHGRHNIRVTICEVLFSIDG